MKACPHHPLENHGLASPRPCRGTAFTLMEMLVVLAIIGILAALALPSIKGLNKSNTIANATQQLINDLALARQTAIRERTTVHVVFFSTNIFGINPNQLPDVRARRTWTNLLSRPLSSYAFYADRTVGDQPGQPRSRYIGAWRTLPDGIIVAEWEFASIGGNAWDTTPLTNRPFATNTFLFPTVNGISYVLPSLSFDSSGSLIVHDSMRNRVRYQDEVVSLAQASVLVQRDPAGNLLEFDVRENPKNNSRENYNRIRIDGLTGRARVERPEIQ